MIVFETHQRRGDYITFSRITYTLQRLFSYFRNEYTRTGGNNYTQVIRRMEDFLFCIFLIFYPSENLLLLLFLNICQPLHTYTHTHTYAENQCSV